MQIYRLLYYYIKAFRCILHNHSKNYTQILQMPEVLVQVSSKAKIVHRSTFTIKDQTNLSELVVLALNKWKISQNYVVQKYNKKFDEYVDIDENEHAYIPILDGERFEIRLVEDEKEEEVDNFEMNKMAPQQPFQKTNDMQQRKPNHIRFAKPEATSFQSSDVDKLLSSSSPTSFQDSSTYASNSDDDDVPIDERKNNSSSQGNADLDINRRSIPTIPLQEPPEVNILVLGETGVGKSTWINAIANYMYFDTLDEAMKAELCCLIPSKFTITDENFKTRDVTIKPPPTQNETLENEVLEKGHSATQDPKIYKLETATHFVRIIDTPGIGDTRGVEQDRANCDKILRLVSQVSNLHGICLIFKPNDSRLTPSFRYCISELLIRLHKHAVQNIVFCFTNARGTFYKPGEIMNPLKSYLEELEKNNKISISLNKSTIFCLDNEAFRFLCAYKSKVKFSKKDIEDFSESWRRSAEETKRLINQVLTVDPHNVIESIQLNEARETILTLTKPLADIAELIETNVKIQTDRKKEIEQTKAKLSQLSKNLQIPQIYLEVAELGYPMTVCTSPNCSTVQKISNTDQMQIIYDSVCHDHCYLEGIKLEAFPQPILKNCYAMNKETDICRICGCVWSLHTHINFTQVKKTKMVEDENIKIKINNNEDAHHIKEQMIAECEGKIEKYKKEQAIIIETCTRFGSFLKANAILPYNDAFDAYVQQCIKEEERCVAQGAPQDKLVALKRLLSEYRQEKEVLERSMESSGVKVSVEEIKSLQQKLFSLEFTGAQIKKLFEASQEGHRKNDGYFEMHVNPAKYFHSKQKSSWSFGNIFTKMFTGHGSEQSAQIKPVKHKQNSSYHMNEGRVSRKQVANMHPTSILKSESNKQQDELNNARNKTRSRSANKEMNSNHPTAIHRIAKDYLDFISLQLPNVFISPVQDNQYEWNFVVRCHEDTPLKDEYLYGVLNFSKDYPIKSPKISLRTPTGVIKIDSSIPLPILEFEHWLPSYSVSSILLELIEYLNEHLYDFDKLEDKASRYLKILLSNYSNLQNAQFCKQFSSLLPEIEHQEEVKFEQLASFEPVSLDIKKNLLNGAIQSNSLSYSTVSWTLEDFVFKSNCGKEFVLSFPVKQWELIVKDYCEIINALNRKLSEICNRKETPPDLGRMPITLDILTGSLDQFQFYSKFVELNNDFLSQIFYYRLQAELMIKCHSMMAIPKAMYTAYKVMIEASKITTEEYKAALFKTLAVYECYNKGKGIFQYANKAQAHLTKSKFPELLHDFNYNFGPDEEYEYDFIQGEKLSFNFYLEGFVELFDEAKNSFSNLSLMLDSQKLNNVTRDPILRNTISVINGDFEEWKNHGMVRSLKFAREKSVQIEVAFFAEFVFQTYKKLYQATKVFDEEYKSNENYIKCITECNAVFIKTLLLYDKVRNLSSDWVLESEESSHIDLIKEITNELRDLGAFPYVLCQDNQGSEFLVVFPLEKFKEIIMLTSKEMGSLLTKFIIMDIQEIYNEYNLKEKTILSLIFMIINREIDAKRDYPYLENIGIALDIQFKDHLKELVTKLEYIYQKLNEEVNKTVITCETATSLNQLKLYKEELKEMEKHFVLQINIAYLKEDIEKVQYRPDYLIQKAGEEFNMPLEYAQMLFDICNQPNITTIRMFLQIINTFALFPEFRKIFDMIKVGWKHKSLDFAGIIGQIAKSIEVEKEAKNIAIYKAMATMLSTDSTGYQEKSDMTFKDARKDAKVYKNLDGQEYFTSFPVEAWYKELIDFFRSTLGKYGLLTNMKLNNVLIESKPEDAEKTLQRLATTKIFWKVMNNLFDTSTLFHLTEDERCFVIDTQLSCTAKRFIEEEENFKSKCEELIKSTSNEETQVKLQEFLDIFDTYLPKFKNFLTPFMKPDSDKKIKWNENLEKYFDKSLRSKKECDDQKPSTSKASNTKLYKRTDTSIEKYLTLCGKDTDLPLYITFPLHEIQSEIKNSTEVFNSYQLGTEIDIAGYLMLEVNFYDEVENGQVILTELKNVKPYDYSYLTDKNLRVNTYKLKENLKILHNEIVRQIAVFSPQKEKDNQFDYAIKKCNEICDSMKNLISKLDDLLIKAEENLAAIYKNFNVEDLFNSDSLIINEVILPEKVDYAKYVYSSTMNYFDSLKKNGPVKGPQSEKQKLNNALRLNKFTMENQSDGVNKMLNEFFTGNLEAYMPVIDIFLKPDEPFNFFDDFYNNIELLLNNKPEAIPCLAKDDEAVDDHLLEEIVRNIDEFAGFVNTVCSTALTRKISGISNETIARDINSIGSSFLQHINCLKLIDLTTFSQHKSYSKKMLIKLIGAQRRLMNLLRQLFTFEASNHRLNLHLQNTDKMLGEGYEARVMESTAFGHFPLAVRIAKKSQIYNPEIEKLKKLKHPQIISILQIDSNCNCLTLDNCTHSLKTMIMEQGDHTLAELIKIKLVPIKTVALMGMHVASGLAFLHENGIIHRDIKPQNIIHTQHGCKIADLGLSIGKGLNEDNTWILSAKGTPQYMAPEIIRGDHSNEKVDIYSFGVLLWEIFFQILPFIGIGNECILAKVAAHSLNLYIPEYMDTLFRDLIERCIKIDPSSRPNAEQLNKCLSDYFFSTNTEFQKSKNYLNIKIACRLREKDLFKEDSSLHKKISEKDNEDFNMGNLSPEQLAALTINGIKSGRIDVYENLNEEIVRVDNLDKWHQEIIEFNEKMLISWLDEGEKASINLAEEHLSKMSMDSTTENSNGNVPLQREEWDKSLTLESIKISFDRIRQMDDAYLTFWKLQVLICYEKQKLYEKNLFNK